MIRFNPNSRTLVIRLPSWRDRRWVAVLLFLLLVDILVSFVDRPLAEVMRGLDPDIVAFFRQVTLAGDSKYYLVPLAMVLPFLVAARAALEDGSLRRIVTWGVQGIGFIFTAVAASGLLVNLLKGLIGRTRPKLWFEAGEYGFAPFTFGEYDYNSMPSGHSNTAFALMMALSCFFPRQRLLLLGAAAVIACSRVIVGSHYPADILVGGVLGILTTLWLRAWFARRGWVFVLRHGQYRLAAPGYLLGVKIRTLLFERFGIADGPRGRLP